MGNDNSNTAVANKIADYGVVSSAYSGTYCHEELNNIADLLAEIQVEVGVRNGELLFDFRTTKPQREWIKLKVEEILACYSRIDDLVLPEAVNKRRRSIKLLAAVEEIRFVHQDEKLGSSSVLRMLPTIIESYASRRCATV